MLSLEEIAEALRKDRNLKEVSRRTGISYGTIWHLAKGLQTNPSYETVKALSDYLEQK